MAASTGNDAVPLSVPAAPPTRAVRARVLCLGNDLLADDAFGFLAAEYLRERLPPAVDVVFSTDAGFALLDFLEDTRLLVVVDVVQTGKTPPGTVSVFRVEDLRGVPGNSPHYVGLFESLDLGRAIGMPVPEEVAIVVVEAADCLTIGGAMHPDVRAAVPEVAARVAAIVG
jgi:hydrogenase maturation protease